VVIVSNVRKLSKQKNIDTDVFRKQQYDVKGWVLDLKNLVDIVNVIISVHSY